MAHGPQIDPSQGDQEQEAPARGLLSLLAFAAIVLTLAAVAAAFGPGTSAVAMPRDGLPLVAALLAVLLVLVYPLWPGDLLGRCDPMTRLLPWLLLRVGEVGLIMAAALPALLVTTVLSGAPLWRAGEVLLALVGTAAAAIAYRFVHAAASSRWRAWAVPDVMFFLFGPLVAGYLVLESSYTSIGWAWLISPLALARAAAIDGMPAGGEVFLIGLVGYTVVAACGLLLARWTARRYQEQHTAHHAEL